MRKQLALVLSLVVLLPPLAASASPPEAVLQDWKDQYRQLEKQIADGVK